MPSRTTATAALSSLALFSLALGGCTVDSNNRLTLGGPASIGDDAGSVELHALTTDPAPLLLAPESDNAVTLAVPLYEARHGASVRGQHPSRHRHDGEHPSADNALDLYERRLPRGLLDGVSVVVRVPTQVVRGVGELISVGPAGWSASPRGAFDRVPPSEVAARGANPS